MNHTSIVLVALSLTVVSACAHGAKGSAEAVPTADVVSDVITPPQMIGVQVVMKLRSSGGRMRGTVEVPVDVNGRPDLTGIRFVGRFDELTRRDLRDYIDQSTFKPAMRNGVPVNGTYKMTFR